MRPSLWGLAIVAFGLAGIVFAGGNLIVLGFSGLFILVGLLVVTVAEVVRWSQSCLSEYNIDEVVDLIHFHPHQEKMGSAPWPAIAASKIRYRFDEPGLRQVLADNAFMLPASLRAHNMLHVDFFARRWIIDMPPELLELGKVPRYPALQRILRGPNIVVVTLFQ